MALIELNSNESVQEFLSANSKALITYSATWCGPCKASKPDLELLASEYSQNVTKGVNFGIVYEHSLGDDIHSYNVRAFPTYVLFVNQVEFGRIEGVNVQGVRDLIESAPPSALIGAEAGHSLGGGGTAPLSDEEARAQRLIRLGGGGATPITNDVTNDSQPDAIMETAATTDTVNATKASSKDVDMEDANKDLSDPTDNLDPLAIKTLTESMGFSVLRAQKGLLYGNGGTVAAAVDWLLKHQDDDDIDHPIPMGPIQIAQSYKCNDCGKILSNMSNLEMHANKTGHADFEESTDVAPIMTPEEKTKKIAEIKELLKTKRAEREEIEKVDDIDREKQRRSMGKEMAKTKEQMDAEHRKRETLLRKREKDSFKRERERLRAELARDKAERIANKGKLSTRLGVGGYKPDGVQYEAGGEGAEAGEAAVVEIKKPKAKISVAKIDEYIKTVSSYRAGGDGGKCLKILNAYVGNAVDNPDEEKFKSINTENKAFKGKVKPFVGAKQLLIAVGFKPNEAGTALLLKEGADTQLLADTKAKLKAALDSY